MEKKNLTLKALKQMETKNPLILTSSMAWSRAPLRQGSKSSCG